MKRFSLGDQGESDGISMASTMSMLMLISRKHSGHGDRSEHPSADRVFECKTCNRRFSSFQALGGHQASHKKPRLADDGHGLAQSAPSKPKVHECSIYGVEFAIGQALGGHMRSHRGLRDGHADDDPRLKSDRKKVGRFDLNLPPWDENFDCRKLGFGLGFGLGHTNC